MSEVNYTELPDAPDLFNHPVPTAPVGTEMFNDAPPFDSLPNPIAPVYGNSDIDATPSQPYNDDLLMRNREENMFALVYNPDSTRNPEVKYVSGLIIHNGLPSESEKEASSLRATQVGGAPGTLSAVESGEKAPIDEDKTWYLNIIRDIDSGTVSGKVSSKKDEKAAISIPLAQTKKGNNGYIQQLHRGAVFLPNVPEKPLKLKAGKGIEIKKGISEDTGDGEPTDPKPDDPKPEENEEEGFTISALIEDAAEGSSADFSIIYVETEPDPSKPQPEPEPAPEPTEEENKGEPYKLKLLTMGSGIIIEDNGDKLKLSTALSVGPGDGLEWQGADKLKIKIDPTVVSQTNGNWPLDLSVSPNGLAGKLDLTVDTTTHQLGGGASVALSNSTAKVLSLVVASGSGPGPGPGCDCDYTLGLTVSSAVMTIQLKNNDVVKSSEQVQFTSNNGSIIIS